MGVKGWSYYAEAPSVRVVDAVLIVRRSEGAPSAVVMGQAEVIVGLDEVGRIINLEIDFTAFTRSTGRRLCGYCARLDGKVAKGRGEGGEAGRCGVHSTAVWLVLSFTPLILQFTRLEGATWLIYWRSNTWELR
ncbi:hypothetical protein [Pyrobaculum ferrireducens]|uniref:Uncharacterized protein n=1 Tax=Pyrobaculum ferrireducens TaxID=1104324 RepID=G7VB14_9CREN|nr:hypothetical protein [Pyrobaculum ferrireducens]AET32324.1 hypothetical protein P186_0883 [Pyrobaculum ferrireducens]